MNASSSEKPLVVYCSANFLPRSQTFVYQELKAHDRYNTAVMATGRQNEDLFVHRPLVTFDEQVRGPLQAPKRLRWLLTGRSQEMEAHLRALNPAVLHAQFGPAALQFLPLARRLGVPLVCTFGGIDVQSLVTTMRYQREYWSYWPYYLQARKMLQGCTRILAVSEDLASKLITFGAPPDRVFVYYRGIDLPDASPDLTKRNPVVVAAGRLVEKKGFRYAIDAFAEIAGSFPEWQLHIFGDGPLRDSLQAAIDAAGMQARIQLKGEVKQSELFTRMSEASLMVVPSVTSSKGDAEGVPNVLKEAAARGLPIVASRHGGIPEVVEEGQTGFLTPERSSGQLSARLRQLMDNQPLRREMAAKAYQRTVERFSRTGQNAELERHYDEARALFPVVHHTERR